MSHRILADWDMSSGRNLDYPFMPTLCILADWDMSSGRNLVNISPRRRRILADWDMSSGRNDVVGFLDGLIF